MLVGCDGLVQTTFRQLETVSTQLSVWEFYKQIENSYVSVQNDFKTEFVKTDNSYPSLYRDLFDAYDNQKNITRILRDSMAVMDLFYSGQTEAIFEYDNLHNYNIVKDETIARNGYRIKYGENLDWHNVLGGATEVDTFMANLILPIEVEGKIATNTSGGYTLDLLQKATFPINAVEIEGKLPQNYNQGSNRITYEFTHETSSTFFTAKLEKAQTNEQEEKSVLYAKQIRIEKLNNITFLTSKITLADGTTNEKTFRLDQLIQGISLGYNQTSGKLDWIINYLGRGQLRVDGEAYFQGTNKMVIKEKYDLVINNPSPYSFKQTFTMEHNIDGANYKMKYFPGQILYTPISEMNMMKLGIYNNEVIALTMQKTSSKPSIQYYG